MCEKSDYIIGLSLYEKTETFVLEEHCSQWLRWKLIYPSKASTANHGQIQSRENKLSFTVILYSSSLHWILIDEFSDFSLNIYYTDSLLVICNCWVKELWRLMSLRVK